MKAIIKWLNRLFAGSQNGPAPTLPNSSLPSKTSSTPAQSTPAKPKSEAKASAWQADPRSEKNLATLEPTTAKLVRELLRRLQSEGLNFKVTSGTRTWAEQTKLYAQGRTTAGPKVTNAKAGQSWHNFGAAADLTLFDKSGKRPKWDGKEYDRMGAIAQELGLEWGGAWRKFKDRPHVQRPLGLTLAEARKKYPGGVVA
jgi:peptidoglycan L-alanyl-D-glutamate endopeptidase CwlK